LHIVEKLPFVRDDVIVANAPSPGNRDVGAIPPAGKIRDGPVLGEVVRGELDLSPVLNLRRGDLNPCHLTHVQMNHVLANDSRITKIVL